MSSLKNILHLICWSPWISYMFNCIQAFTGLLLSLTIVINSAKEPKGNFTGQSIHRWFANNTMLTGNMTLVLHHCCSKACNIIIHGCLIEGQLYTHPLNLPYVHASNFKARLCNLFQLTWMQDTPFMDLCKQAVNMDMAHAKAFKHQRLNQSLQELLRDKAHHWQDYSSLCKLIQDQKASMASTPRTSLCQIFILCMEIHYWCSKGW